MTKEIKDTSYKGWRDCFKEGSVSNSTTAAQSTGPLDLAGGLDGTGALVVLGSDTGQGVGALLLCMC